MSDTQKPSLSVVTGSESQQRTAFDALVDGVARFREEIFPEHESTFRALATGQNPHTLLVTCADSRIVPEMITQAGPGSLFVCRNIGNVVPAYGEMLGGVSAIVEYACVALEVSQIVICGHSDCGAMKALLDPDGPALARMPTVRSWLRNAEAARGIVEATRPELDGADKVQALVERNVLVQLQNLRTHPAVAARLAEGRLALHGWVYGIKDGSVTVIDETTGAPRPLGRSLDAAQ